MCKTLKIEALISEETKSIATSLRGLYLQSVVFDTPVHTTVLADDLLLISGVGIPKLHFRAQLDSMRNRLAVQFSRKELQGQSMHPLPRFSSFELIGQKVKSQVQKGPGKFTFGFATVQHVLDTSLYRLNYVGKEDYIDREYFDERDKIQEVALDIRLDIALGIKLENEKMLLLTIEPGRDNYFLLIGRESTITQSEFTKSYLLNQNEAINWTPITLS